MGRSPSPDDELRAAVEARRELGPEFEDSLVEGFLEKMNHEIDRRVDERVAARTGRNSPAAKPADAGQRLALAIISLSLGVPGTVGLAFADLGTALVFVLVPLWIGIVGVNATFNGNRSDQPNRHD
ncbi:hypothetical protein [Streptosporangium carneum]|uniref:DUF3040 domain-containing protein n=1 Tax=Streptosporangium carneum TaxID=47481 RepID=A0A9W6I6G5_9ACTN|nr:hypothetical protein [Streptosporangium carneum]GLK12960.1 hypothetical protein GCM10017600_63700 [Streptosporangium carneum]